MAVNAAQLASPLSFSLSLSFSLTLSFTHTYKHTRSGALHASHQSTLKSCVDVLLLPSCARLQRTEWFSVHYHCSMDATLDGSSVPSESVSHLFKNHPYIFLHLISNTWQWQCGQREGLCRN